MAVREVLIEKQLIGADEARRQIEVLEYAHSGPRRQGRGPRPESIPPSRRGCWPMGVSAASSWASASTTTPASSCWRAPTRSTA